jgi:acetaldehyde dehydrogenase (acetylating)
MKRVAIFGNGNIGSDLREKVRASPSLEPVLFAGVARGRREAAAVS